jgi:hypothetical protein
MIDKREKRPMASFFMQVKPIPSIAGQQKAAHQMMDGSQFFQTIRQFLP